LPFIKIESLSHVYTSHRENPVQALRGIDLEIEEGEYVALVGANGSGKSTLALHLNALLLPTSGKVWVDEMDTSVAGSVNTIRSTVGMVFQSPADQIVATVIEEDVAFGPENLGVPEEELPLRVREALERVGMWEERHRPPHLLSAGQRQQVAIAGTLAMNPRCIVLDEATAMLDPSGSRELLNILGDLQRGGITIVNITHRMEEAACARRIVVIHEGRIVADGSPRSVFSHENLGTYGLSPPLAARLAGRLRERFSGLPGDILTIDELADALTGMASA